jgi:hypothetical protein
MNRKARLERVGSRTGLLQRHSAAASLTPWQLKAQARGFLRFKTMNRKWLRVGAPPESLRIPPRIPWRGHGDSSAVAIDSVLAFFGEDKTLREKPSRSFRNREFNLALTRVRVGAGGKPHERTTAQQDA